MSQPDREQREVHHALRDHSDRFLDTLDEIGKLETEDRAEPIGSRPFAASARDVKLAADKLREISESQEDIGNDADRTDVTIDDIARAEDRNRAP